MSDNAGTATEITLPAMTGAPAHLSLDPVHDQLTVLEYGAVWDGQPPELNAVLEEDERIGFLLREPEGPTIGFGVAEPHDVDAWAITAAEMWEAPRFTVPLLGLREASVGEVLLVVQARFGRDEPTTDAAFFHQAVDSSEDLDVAEGLWRGCLEAGDMRAHFGLGYTLVELERPRDAYDHLRAYTVLTPHNAWAWLWRGRAAEEMGEVPEAVKSYEQAVWLEERGSFETDAGERLEALV